MSTDEWAIVIGVVMSGLLALGPWMFMVHAKLAVLTTQMTGLEEKVDRLIAESDRREPMCVLHQARLDTHEIQLDHVDQRLRDLE